MFGGCDESMRGLWWPFSCQKFSVACQDSIGFLCVVPADDTCLLLGLLPEGRSSCWRGFSFTNYGFRISELECGILMFKFMWSLRSSCLQLCVPRIPVSTTPFSVDCGKNEALIVLDFLQLYLGDRSSVGALVWKVSMHATTGLD